MQTICRLHGSFTDYQTCSVCVHVCLHVCVGLRSEIGEADLSEVLPEEVEEEVRQAAEISMGTEACPTATYT